MSETIALKNLCEIEITDGTHKTPTYVEEGIIFLSSKNVTSGEIDWDNVMYIPHWLHEELYKRIAPQKDDILLAKNGTTGIAAIVDRDEIFDIYVSLALIRPDKNKVLPRYLLYAINSNSSKKFFDSHLKGIGVPNLHLTYIRETPIKVLSFEEQQYIIDVLDKVNNIISCRRKQLLKLDKLIQSRFIEMFGDPRINPKGYDIVPISSLFDVGSSKRVFESEWRESGVPFYRAREIVKLSRDGYVDNDLFIEEEMYEAYKAKYGVPKAGDMMVTGVGTLGVCYIVKETDRFYFKDGNTLWFKNKGLCDVRFIKDQYDTDFVKEQITANANVSTVGTYTITNANNTLVLLPPLAEQEQYVEFCKQTDKSKLAVQKSLEKFETLKKALMQKYFE